MKLKKWGIILGLGAILAMTGCSKKSSVDAYYTDTGLTSATGTPLPQPEPKGLPQGVGNIPVNNGELPQVMTQEMKEREAFLKLPVAQQKKIIADKLHNIVVYFDFDSYMIRPDQLPKIEKMAKIIQLNPNLKFLVRIEGNTDEWGTEEYNYALGLKRAMAVRDVLIRQGVPASKLVTISYGELNPVCTAHTPECWAKNRRDNFTLIEP
jgi:peptidoglycan-associated lipoprotein